MDVLSTMRLRKNPVIFDASDRFIFFPNNKCCQKSIVRNVLKNRSIIQKFGYARWSSKFEEVTTSYVEQIFKFTVVRNPYDRAVSAFRYLQGRELIDTNYTFNGFCKDVLRKFGTDYDPHFDPQSDGLFHAGKLIPSYVAKYETIDEDWKFIADAVGCTSKLPHDNKSERSRNTVEYYDSESLSIVFQIYKDDFRNFGYGRSITWQ